MREVVGIFVLWFVFVVIVCFCFYSRKVVMGSVLVDGRGFVLVRLFL